MSPTDQMPSDADHFRQELRACAELLRLIKTAKTNAKRTYYQKKFTKLIGILQAALSDTDMQELIRQDLAQADTLTSTNDDAPQEV